MNINKEDKITKQNRKLLVRDYNYGEILELDARKDDIPVKAKIEYNDNGNSIFSDFSELEKYLNEVFIPTNIKVKTKKDHSTGKQINYESIQLNKIVKLGLSEAEVEYIFNYLENKNIRIAGINSSMSGTFKNYDYIRTYSNVRNLPNPLPPEEQDKLLKEYRKTGNIEIRNKLIESNSRLVPFICWRYTIFTKLSLDEITSFGYEGLITAIESYAKKEKVTDAKLTTYIANSIKWKVINGLAKMEGFKESEQYFLYLEARNAILEYYNDNEEDIPEDICQDIIELVESTGKYSNDNLEELKRRINTKQYIPIEDLREDELIDDYTLDWHMATSLANQRINNALDNLPSREKDIIERYYGMNNQEEHNDSEIASFYNLKPQTICSLRNKALRRLLLRNIINHRNLQSCLEEFDNLPSEPLENTTKILIK